MNRYHLLVVCGIAPLLLTPIWIFVIAPEFEKLPSNYHYYEEQIGLNSIVSQYGDKLPTPFKHFNTYEIKVVGINNNILKIESNLQATNVDNGFKFLDETRNFFITRDTRAHETVEKGYFLFPPNTQQHDYFLTFPLAFTHATFTFEGKDIVQGLEVYKFSCISQPYDITNAIPQFKGYKVMSYYQCVIWIEPVTGKHVDFLLEWESFYEENNEITFLAEKGHKRTSPEYVTKLVSNVKEEKMIFQIYNMFIPIILLVGGSLILITSRFFIIRKTTELEIVKSKLSNEVDELEEIVKQRTTELIKAEKLSTIGQLSSRISHDIRNPLAVLLASLDIIKQLNTNKDPRMQRSLDLAAGAIERIRHQVNDVLDFIRITPLHLENVSLTKLITSVLETLKIPSNVEVILPTHDFEIECDKQKLEIVFVNILYNAFQSIEEQNGSIHIRLFNELNKSIKIEIENTGPPIQKEDISKIFEPLFTTKSKGTGLGLPSCKNIVEQHKGTITVNPDPVIFTITLPIKQDNSTGDPIHV
jgi:signal transduction histidine kinase